MKNNNTYFSFKNCTTSFTPIKFFKLILVFLVVISCESNEIINDDVKLTDTDDLLEDNSSLYTHKNAYGYVESIRIYLNRCLPPVSDKNSFIAYSRKIVEAPKLSTLRGQTHYKSYFDRINRLWGIRNVALRYISGKVDLEFKDENDQTEIIRGIDIGKGAFAYFTWGQSMVILGDTYIYNSSILKVIGVIAHEMGHVIHRVEIRSEVDRMLYNLREIRKARGKELFADYMGGIALGHIWERYFRDSYPRELYYIGDYCSSSIDHHGLPLQRQTAARIGIKVGAWFKEKYYNYDLSLRRSKIILLKSFGIYWNNILSGRSKLVEGNKLPLTKEVTTKITKEIEYEMGDKLSNTEKDIVKNIIKISHEVLAEQNKEN